VQLKPGGYHVMLMDLKRPLAVGEKVRVELRIETREKRMVTQPVDVEVRAQPPGKDDTAHKH
jgi:copper(I)-binding protein